MLQTIYVIKNYIIDNCKIIYQMYTLNTIYCVKIRLIHMKWYGCFELRLTIYI